MTENIASAGGGRMGGVLQGVNWGHCCTLLGFPPSLFLVSCPEREFGTLVGLSEISSVQCTSACLVCVIVGARKLRVAATYRLGVLRLAQPDAALEREYRSHDTIA